MCQKRPKAFFGKRERAGKISEFCEKRLRGGFETRPEDFIRVDIKGLEGASGRPVSGPYGL